MSSSEQNISLPQEPSSDQVMMEAPDSPPEIQNSSASISFAAQTPSSSQQSAPQANSIASRSNGDSTAKVNHGAPGSSWASKKFHDEYDRTLASLYDPNWDASRYGDPLVPKSG